jgi:hypothetical protein
MYPVKAKAAEVARQPRLLIHKTTMVTSTQLLIPEIETYKPKRTSIRGVDKPLIIRHHVDGRVSIRVYGRWIHDLELDPRLALSWSGKVHETVMRRNGHGNGSH